METGRPSAAPGSAGRSPGLRVRRVGRYHTRSPASLRRGGFGRAAGPCYTPARDKLAADLHRPLIAISRGNVLTKKPSGSPSPVARALRFEDLLDTYEGPAASIPNRITKLMIAAMGKFASRFADCTVLDFGCGGGHLSFAALELGASKVIGVDRDPSCIRTLRCNLARSRFAEDRLEIILAKSLQEVPVNLLGTADIVISNPAQIVLPHEQALPSYGYDGPDGRNMLDHFIDHFNVLLADSGIAFLSNSCFADPAKTVAALASRGYDAQPVVTGMVALYKQLYAPEILDHLQALPHLSRGEFVAEPEGKYRFQAVCFKIENQHRNDHCRLRPKRETA